MTRISENGTAYDLLGPQDAPVIALIHGLGLCRHLWRDHIASLSRHYRVLNYDLFGHGESAPAPEKASLTVYSEQLLAVLNEVSVERVAIIGFSIGGMINRRFALDHPDRLSALAILNSPHERAPEAQVLVEERAAKVISEGAMATMGAALERWFTPGFRAAHPEVLDRVRHWRELTDTTTYPDACMVLAAGVKELIRPAVPVDIPSLVLTSENDSGSTPDMSRAIASEIPVSETVIFPKYQHLGLMEDPSAFTSPVLDFLNRTLD